MSLPHALLTALVERPCSGSELAARFDRSIGYFWHATHQQIYRELGRLEQAKLVEALPEEQGRGRKRAYRILPAGRKELKRWIAQRSDPAPLREEILVRLRAEAAVGPAGLEKEILRQLHLHQDALSGYREIERRDFGKNREDREAALQYLVLRSGILYESFWIEILEEALKALQLPARGRGTSTGDRI